MLRKGEVGEVKPTPCCLNWWFGSDRKRGRLFLAKALLFEEYHKKLLEEEEVYNGIPSICTSC